MIWSSLLVSSFKIEWSLIDQIDLNDCQGKMGNNHGHILTLKVLITAAQTTFWSFFFLLLAKIRHDISTWIVCKQMIRTKHQILFSLKNDRKCRLSSDTILPSALGVNAHADDQVNLCNCRPWLGCFSLVWKSLSYNVHPAKNQVSLCRVDALIQVYFSGKTIQPCWIP